MSIAFSKEKYGEESDDGSLLHGENRSYDMYDGDESLVSFGARNYCAACGASTDDGCGADCPAVLERPAHVDLESVRSIREDQLDTVIDEYFAGALTKAASR